MSDFCNIYIRNNFQKTNQTGELAEHIFTDEVLSDLTKRVTGQESYRINFVNPDETIPFEKKVRYNRGRLAYIVYKNKITIVTFTPQKIESRNSPFQTLGAALSALYDLQGNLEYAMYDTELAYYFVHKSGSFDTDYAKFMFKAITTMRVKILNPPYFLEVSPFRNILELISAKNKIRENNSSNKSTHIMIGSESKIEVYAKTYGANKYESAVLAVACSNLVDPSAEIVVYEISDNSLSKLPNTVHRIFDWLGIIYSTSDAEIRRSIIQNSSNVISLRSPSFISNMLDVHGVKKCNWCECAVPQLIEAAHILPVSYIKNSTNRTLEEKFIAANDSNNGIWLCRNHHKLFDSELAALNSKFKILTRMDLVDENYQNYVSETIVRDYLLFNDMVNLERVRDYIKERNESLQMSLFG